MDDNNGYLLIPGESYRERVHRRGHIAAMHTWWGRRTLTTARAAVFTAIASQSQTALSMLKRICVHLPQPNELDAARQLIREEYARRNPPDTGDDPYPQAHIDTSATPRVLDMFAGGGSIPLEALRLGAQAYAVDLDPTAYLIELCTINYPQQYMRPSKAFGGSGENATWAGLTQEILSWASWVQEQAIQELRQYYPDKVTLTHDSQHIDVEPLVYIWARTIDCPTCDAQIPLGRPIRLTDKPGLTVTLVPRIDATTKRLSWELEDTTHNNSKHAPSSAAPGRSLQCKACGFVFTPQQVRDASIIPMIAGCIYRRDGDVTNQVASQQMFSNSLQEPDNERVRQGLQQLRDEMGPNVPDEALPSGRAYGPVRYNFRSFGDLFTPRQALMLLTFCKWIRRSHEAMSSLGMGNDRATAVSGYLGLLVSEFARRHSAFTTWNPRLQAPTPIFGRMSVPMTWEFAEATPFSSQFSYLGRADSILRVVEECSDVSRPAQVFCASATHLPFESGYFDAVVADPPYYDQVPYADLAAFFYVWLKRSVGAFYPKAFRHELPPTDEEIVVATHRHGEDTNAVQAAYFALMQQALHEAVRVLKSTGHMTLIFNSREPATLETLLGLTQRAGFELFSASRIEPIDSGEQRRQTQEANADTEPEGVGRYLLAFRKAEMAMQLTESAVDAAVLLDLTENNQPALYNGLADLIEDELPPEEIAQYIPTDFQGSEHDKLVEYVATVGDPEQFLTEQLGKHTLRQIATSRGWIQHEAYDESPAQIILRRLGFNVPGRPKRRVIAAIERLRELLSRAQIATTAQEIEGYVSDGMKRVETVLKESVFAWARAICAAEADDHLRSILESTQGTGRHISLERLTMGNVIALFCGLPDYLAKHENLCARCQELVGRPHIYKIAKEKASLDQLVSLRNRVIHNSDVAGTDNVDEIRQLGAHGLEMAAVVLAKLKDAGAIPLVGQPIRETRDIFNRRTITLKMEDGTVREVFMAEPLELGKNYLYLAARNNPRAVNPLLILLTERG